MEPMDIVGRTKEDASLPKVSEQMSQMDAIIYSLVINNNDYFSATMTKIIKEMLPPDVRVARDAQDLLIECCVGNNMGGKGIRRREKNYTAAHGGGNNTRLPPPPVPSSIDVLPSKLRKLMSLAGAKHSLNHGKKNAGDVTDKGVRLGGGSESITTRMKRKRDDVLETSQNEKKKKKRKSKKSNDLRFEALDAAAAACGSRKKDRKKKLSEAKKKKQENAQIEEDLNFPGREHIKFGDIVEAPPKLTVPKAFKVTQDASHERLRLHAVKAYRKRKAWGSRPGVKLPPPTTS